MSRLRPDDPAQQKPIKHVYVLSYLGWWEGNWSGVFVGVYSSVDQAERAKKRVLERPIFRDRPHTFRIDGMILDGDYDDPYGLTGYQPPPSGPPPGDPAEPKSTES